MSAWKLLGDMFIQNLSLYRNFSIFLYSLRVFCRYGFIVFTPLTGRGNLFSFHRAVDGCAIIVCDNCWPSFFLRMLYFTAATYKTQFFWKILRHTCEPRVLVQIIDRIISDSSTCSPHEWFDLLMKIRLTETARGDFSHFVRHSRVIFSLFGSLSRSVLRYIYVISIHKCTYLYVEQLCYTLLPTLRRHSHVHNTFTTLRGFGRPFLGTRKIILMQQWTS